MSFLQTRIQQRLTLLLLDRNRFRGGSPSVSTISIQVHKLSNTNLEPNVSFTDSFTINSPENTLITPHSVYLDPSQRNVFVAMPNTS